MTSTEGAPYGLDDDGVSRPNDVSAPAVQRRLCVLMWSVRPILAAQRRPQIVQIRLLEGAASSELYVYRMSTHTVKIIHTSFFHMITYRKNNTRYTCYTIHWNFWKPLNVTVTVADIYNSVHERWIIMHFNNVADYWAC